MTILIILRRVSVPLDERGRDREAYKQMIVDSNSSDIVYSNLFTGVHGNYLKGSIAAAGLDPADLPESDPSTMDFSSGGNLDAKAWRDTWVLAKSFLFRT